MILSASGGLVYHARAAIARIKSLIDGDDRWAPTRRSVSTCVREWLRKIAPETLILFGPSAGYLLDRDVFKDSFAGRAVRVVVVDPDPVAKMIFRARFPNLSFDWQTRADLLPFTSADPEAFAKFVTSCAEGKAGGLRKTAVLFLGVLGQIEFHATQFARSKSEARQLLMATLNGVSWASLHDLESTRLSVPAKMQTFANVPAQFKSDAERIAFFASSLAVESEWVDHDTQWLGPPATVIPWMLSAKKLNVMGFVR